MYSEALKAQRELANEIDKLAAKLIRDGIPLYDAIEQAKRIIRQRRAGGCPWKGQR